MTAKGLVLTCSAQPTAVWRLDRARVPHLLPVANRPILLHALEAMRCAGISEVCIATAPHNADAINCAVGDGSALGLEVRYLGNHHAAGPGAAVLAAADFIGDAPVVIHTGDGLLTEGLDNPLGQIDGTRHAALLLVYAGATSAERDLLETQRLLRFVRREQPQRPGVAGVWCMAGGAVAAARSAYEDVEQRLEISDLLERVEHGGGNVATRPTRAWRRFTGNAMDLLALNRMALERLEGNTYESEGLDSHIEGYVDIDPTAVVQSSVIRGPVIIGPGAQICDSFIGPYSSIGAGARIEGAEVEHSIICSGAQILHVGGRMEASVVGRDAKVFRDFSVPRALRLQVGDGVEVALC